MTEQLSSPNNILLRHLSLEYQFSRILARVLKTYRSVAGHNRRRFLIIIGFCSGGALLIILLSLKHYFSWKRAPISEMERTQSNAEGIPCSSLGWHAQISFEDENDMKSFGIPQAAWKRPLDHKSHDPRPFSPTWSEVRLNWLLTLLNYL